VRGEFVDVAGCRLYYYAAGTRGAGEPVVFLHGFPGSSHLWHDVVPLMPPGHRLVVLDQLGSGRSDRPSRTSLSVTAHAERLRLLLDDLRIDAACLVGHGSGGAVAQALAILHPERVTRLALVDSTAFSFWLRRAAPLARLLAGVGTVLGAPILAGLVHGSMLGGFADPDSGRRALDQYLRAYTAQLGVHALMAQLRAMRDVEVASLAPRLASITAPTSVIWGADDPYLSATVGQRLADAIPGATFELIVDARHYAPNDTPDRVATAIGRLLARRATTERSEGAG
jgi:pimeloyl-ACP methyl ester carboxylesterase